MRTLEPLSDQALTKLAVLTNVERPKLPTGLGAPRFWEAFADAVAHECARRHGLVEAADEPSFPNLPAEELEGASLWLLAMADAERTSPRSDAALADVLLLIAETLMGLRQMATEAQGN